LECRRVSASVVPFHLSDREAAVVSFTSLTNISKRFSAEHRANSHLRNNFSGKKGLPFQYNRVGMELDLLFSILIH
jgi:hypothetical protein